MGLGPLNTNNEMQATVSNLSVPNLRHRAPSLPNRTPTQLELWSTGSLGSERERVDVERARTSFGLELTRVNYRELDLALDPHDEAIWCSMRLTESPNFTTTLLTELISVRRKLQRMFADFPPGEATPIKYFVGGSRRPGIYNLGGDLNFFIKCIRTGDLEALRGYAHDCIDVAYHMTVGFHLPLITVALVQGDALGGGFEGALSFNVLVAEKSAKFGLPEILFNMFPGMGGFSFLSRKLDAVRARKMILTGRIYSANELYEMGLVDVLAEDGCGEVAVRDYIAHNRSRHTVHRRVRDVHMRVNPVSREELLEVTNIWAEHAMTLQAADLRNMERLANAQLRRLNHLHG